MEKKKQFFLTLNKQVPMTSKDTFLLYEKLFSNKKIDLILSDECFIKNILLIEKSLAKVNAECKIIPYAAYLNIKKSLNTYKINYKNLSNDLDISGVITVNIIESLKNNISDIYKQYLHYGVTSQDILDTALILQIRDLKSLLFFNLEKLSKELLSLMSNNSDSIMLGRTRNTQATLTTFGLKVSNWLSPLLRHTKRLENVYNGGLLNLQFGGSVGNLAMYKKKGLLVKKKLSNELKLNYKSSVWHNQRDNLVEFTNILSFITGTIGKIAKDLLFMSQSEVNEIAFTRSGKSTAMPHKKNPIVAELLVTIANLNSSNLSIMHNAISHENERDGVSWMMEWKVLYDMIKLCFASLYHSTNCIKSLKINKKIMINNIDKTYGCAMSDFYFIKLLDFYSYKELKRIFPRLLKKAYEDKIHLVNVINNELGNKANLEKNINYSNFLGVNNKLIKDVIRDYNFIY